jgi:hypothetical protein
MVLGGFRRYIDGTHAKPCGLQTMSDRGDSLSRECSHVPQERGEPRESRPSAGFFIAPCGIPTKSDNLPHGFVTDHRGVVLRRLY